jgi:hypothetical protein
MKSGIVKVTPPKEWLDMQPSYDETIKSIHVKNPIMQNIVGSFGCYVQSNIEQGRSYDLPQWKKTCDKPEHQPPGRRGEVRQGMARQPPTTKAPRTSTPSTPGAKRKRAGASKKKKGAKKARKSKSSKTQEDDEEEEVRSDEEGKEDGIDRPPTPSSQDSQGESGRQTTVTMRRMNNKRSAPRKIDEEAFKDFEYLTDNSYFTPETCERLETQYWRSITYAAPMYGGDQPGTLFTPTTKTWNLGDLPNLLDITGAKIPGVNTAYLYLGMWKATFAWHLEDMDLYSINYLHFGAPKQWYSIKQDDRQKFEDAMSSAFPGERDKCSEFIRHKTFLISPNNPKLASKGITVNKIVHYPGEFVITFPLGYHSGYNLGFNCAEAVNFAMPSWIPLGKAAKACACASAQDSVYVDAAEIERKLQGKTKLEYYGYDSAIEEDLDDDDDDDEIGDLPTPDSNGETRAKTSIPRARMSTNGGGKNGLSSTRKRKRPTSSGGTDFDTRLQGGSSSGDLKRRNDRCALCPNESHFEDLIPIDSVPNGGLAHRICAQYISEVNIEKVEDGQEMAQGFHHIPKSRWNLKCLHCKVQRGACFQCSHVGCKRAYHPTCAAEAGVFAEVGEAKCWVTEDGKQVEYKDDAVFFNCRIHRCKLNGDQAVDGENDASELSQRHREMARSLKPPQTIQVKDDYKNKFRIYAGALKENNIEEEYFVFYPSSRGGDPTYVKPLNLYPMYDDTNTSQWYEFGNDGRLEIPPIAPAG